MSLRIGDHLIIKRDGVILDPESEAYHEFEVMEQPEHFPAPDSKFQYKSGYNIKVEVVE